MIALNDPSAIHACLQLDHAGYRVPAEISVVGFDDTDPLLDSDGRNLLTTVRTPLRELGGAAARLLLEGLEAPDQSDREITLSPTLVIRGSTAAPSPRA